MLEEMSTRGSRLRSRSLGRHWSSAGDGDDVVRMPRLSDSMSEATIVGWLKQLGEPFRPWRAAGRGRDGQGDDRLRGRGGRRPRPRSSFPKAAPRRSGTDRPARRDGRRRPTRARARGGRPGSLSVHLQRARPRRRIPVGAPSAGAARSVDGKRARATPVARRTASQLGVSLSGLTGTGPWRPHPPARRVACRVVGRGQRR